MDCQEIKNIIPRYFKHTASEDEIKLVEEHLCICHECRTTLGELMDTMDEPSSNEKSENLQPQENLAADNTDKTPEFTPKEPEKSEDEEIEYFSADEAKIPDSTIKPSLENVPKEPEPEPKLEPLPEPVPEPEPEPELEPEPEPEPVPEPEPEPEPEPVPEPVPEPEPDNEPSFQEPSPEPELKPKPDAGSLGPEKSFKDEYSADQDYSLDEIPIDNNKLGVFEYTCLGIGVITLGVLFYLLLKG